MKPFRSIFTMALVLFIMGGCVVLAVYMPGTQSGFVNVNEKDNAVNKANLEVPEEEKPFLPEREEPAADTGSITPTGDEGAGPVDDQDTSGADENANAGDGGPPAWVPEQAQQGYDWSQSEKEGPPPWAGKKKPD